MTTAAAARWSRSHPYLRAYMAGLVVPSATVFVVGVVVAGLFRRVPGDVERAMIFPVAINPAIWGAWNALHVALRRRRLPIGWHGAVLPLVLIPVGFALARALSLRFVRPLGTLLITPPTVLAYYVIWKYLVGYLNDILQISGEPPRPAAVEGERS